MKNAFRVVVFLLTIVSLLSCSAGGVATVFFKDHKLSPGTEAIQKKSDVEIALTSLSASSTYDYPELFTFSLDNLPDNFNSSHIKTLFPEDYQGNHWYYTFGVSQDVLVAYTVKIKNETSHILRMKDARIYLVAEGQDPVGAVNLLGKTNLVPTQVGKVQALSPRSYLDADGSLVDWVTQVEAEFERGREKGMFSITYPIGLGSQVIAQNIRSYKLVNDLSREILPKTTFEGILLFPVYCSTFEQAKLMFYDITTKTDAAGNPVEKVTFEFPINSFDQQMWFDSEKEQRWKPGVPDKLSR